MNSAIGYEAAKENSNEAYDNFASDISNSKGQTSQKVYFPQHRVALSDVTSQISNKLCASTTNNSLKQSVEDSKSALVQKSSNMVRNETYYMEDDGDRNYFVKEEDDKMEGMYRAPSEIQEREKEGDTQFKVGSVEEEGRNEGETVGKNTVEEEEEDDDSDDELKEPLYPVSNAKSQRILDQAYQECHRETPDPMDDDTYDVVMVMELSSDIFPYMRELEIKYRPNPYYMDSQPELKWSYRSTLIDWIVQVHSRFQLLPETLYLTVNIIDRFLSKKAVTLNRFQLVGAAALFLAAKYEEINCPTLKDIIYMLDNAYTKEDIIKAEKFMIDALQFEIGWPGPMSFLRRISKADDYEYDVRTLAKYLLETTVMDSKLAAAPPSWLATGAYFLSRVILGSNDWSTKHVYYSGYTQDQIFPLATAILENCRYAEKRHQAIWKKYSERRQHRSAHVVAKWIALAERKVDQSSA